jgi:uncharacterized protein (DUF2384 family)
MSGALAAFRLLESEASRCWSVEAAEVWLFNPNPRLDRRAPIDLVSSDPREVWYTLLADAWPCFGSN